MSSEENYKYEVREPPLATVLVFNQQLRTAIVPRAIVFFMEIMPTVMQVESETEEEVAPERIQKATERIKGAASKGDWRGLRSYWDKRRWVVEFFILGEQPINVMNGWTIFHILASHGHHVALERLLTETCGKDGMIMNRPSRDEDTALHLAAAKGHYHTVKVLLEKGQVGKDLGYWNNKGETVFHLASNTRNTDRILKLLLRHALEESDKGTLDLHTCLNQKDEECGRNFFHRLVARRCYGSALSVLEESIDQHVLQELGRVACEREDTHRDTALFLLLKKESSFFASKRGQIAVKLEVHRQLREESSNEPREAAIADEWIPMTVTRAGLVVKWMSSTRARLLVTWMRIWARLNRSDAIMPFDDTLLLYLGNAGLVNALRPFFWEWRALVKISRFGSDDENVLQIAARDRMTKFIDWFIIGRSDSTHADWAGTILRSTDKNGRTALHYAALTSPRPVAHPMAGFATEINQDYQWFERIKAIMPPDLVSKKGKSVVGGNDGREVQLEETAEDMFFRLRKEKAEKHADSARTMANTIMSVVAAVAFATTFTLPTGLLENSEKLKHKDVVRFTFFVCTYVLGLSFAATTIVTSLALCKSPFTVKNCCTSIPRMFRLCLANLFLCLLFMLAAFGCNLHMSFVRFGMAKFTIFFTLMVVGPLLAALVYYSYVWSTTTRGWIRRPNPLQPTSA